MNLDFFKTMPAIRNTLFFSNYIFTESDLFGKVSFDESVNTGDDLTVGSCIMSSIEFQLNNLNYLINKISGSELVWKQAVLTGKSEYTRLAKATRSKLVCINGPLAYVVSNRYPYLAIWDVETASKISDPASPPTLPILALTVKDNKLHCLHEQEPYITAYTISEEHLTVSEIPELSEYEVGKIKALCAKSYSANVQGDILKEYRMDYQNLSPVNLLENTHEYLQMGVFIAENPEKINETRIKVKCYDRMSRFDRYVDNWLKNIAYPISLKNLLSSLCSQVGVKWKVSQITNENYIIPKNFEGSNINGLQVLRWITEVGACFGKMNRLGSLATSWYQPVDFTVTNAMYSSLTTADYRAEGIDKVQVQTTENDIGIIVPSNDETKQSILSIIDNPLLYAESDVELRAVVENIYNAVKNISYQPYTMKLQWENPLVQAGDIITIVPKTGESFPAYMMSRSLKSSADTYEAPGNEKRESQSDATNQSIQRLRGKTNELTRTIDETRLEMKDADAKLETKITVTASEIRQEVSAGDAKLSSAITQTATEIRQEVKAADTKLSSTITQTAAALEGKIQDNAGNISSIKLTISGFEAAVNNSKLGFNKDGLTITNGGFKIVSGNKTVFYIDSDGQVQSFGSLTTVGERFTTKITGGSIKTTSNSTGSVFFNIEANRVSLASVYCSSLSAEGAVTANSLSSGHGPILGASLSVTGAISGYSLTVTNAISCGSLSTNGTISCSTLDCNTLSYSGSLTNLTNISCSNLSVGNQSLQTATMNIDGQYIRYWTY